MRKKLIVIPLGLAALAAPALAILGVGDIVYDPSNFAEAVQQLAQMEQQYFQLVQTYQMISNQYAEMRRMAQQLPAQLAARYRTLTVPWASSSARNTYGNTALWTAGMNSGLNVPEAYSAATEPLASYGDGWINIPADEMDRVKASYATVELTDGANLAAMQTVGQLRAHAPALETAIQNLEDDSLSSNPDLNTEIAVLNKINASHVIALRTQQSTNQLLVALTEAQVVQSKRERDTEAQGIKDHIQFINQAARVMAAQAAGASDAMNAWRMP